VVAHRGWQLALLEKGSITTVKYNCNRVIFGVIPSNSNNITFVDRYCNMWLGNRIRQQKICLVVIPWVNCNAINCCDL
jgi:hypothetical protein